MIFTALEFPLFSKICHRVQERCLSSKIFRSFYYRFNAACNKAAVVLEIRIKINFIELINEDGNGAGLKSTGSRTLLLIIQISH